MQFVIIGIAIFAVFFIIGCVIVSIPGVKSKLKKEPYSYSDIELESSNKIEDKNCASNDSNYSKVPEYIKD